MSLENNSPGHFSAANSTDVPLPAGGQFIGNADPIGGYSEIDYNLFADPPTATGTIFFEFSMDAINWNISVPLPVFNPQQFVPQVLRVILPFFRLRYVNGPVDQDTFRLMTIYHSVTGGPLRRFPLQNINEAEGMSITRSLIMGQDGIGVSGQTNFLNLHCVPRPGANDGILVVRNDSSAPTSVQTDPNTRLATRDSYTQSSIVNLDALESNWPAQINAMLVAGWDFEIALANGKNNNNIVAIFLK